MVIIGEWYGGDEKGTIYEKERQAILLGERGTIYNLESTTHGIHGAVTVSDKMLFNDEYYRRVNLLPPLLYCTTDNLEVEADALLLTWRNLLANAITESSRT